MRQASNLRSRHRKLRGDLPRDTALGVLGSCDGSRLSSQCWLLVSLDTKRPLALGATDFALAIFATDDETYRPVFALRVTRALAAFFCAVVTRTVLTLLAITQPLSK